MRTVLQLLRSTTRMTPVLPTSTVLTRVRITRTLPVHTQRRYPRTQPLLQRMTTQSTTALPRLMKQKRRIAEPMQRTAVQKCTTPTT